MSVALGLDPASLLELDGAMYDALERAAAARWTVADELAALAIEVAHGHFLAFLGAHTSKGTRLPPPLRVPRPTEEGFERPRVVTASAFAAEFGPRGPDAR